MPEIECRLSLRHADFIMQNHRVHGVSVMPGVTFLDIVYRILIAKGFDHRRAELHNVLFTEAVATADGLDREIRVLVGPEEDGVRQVTGESRQAGGDDSSWRRNFSAELRFAGGPEPGRLDLAAVRARATTRRDIAELYAQARGERIEHGAPMRCRGPLFQGDGELLAELDLESAGPGHGKGFHLHPAVLDAASIVAYGQRPSPGDPFIPVFIERFRAHRPLRGRCHVHVPSPEEFATSGDVVHNDCFLYDEEGLLVAEFRKLTCKRIRHPELITKLVDGEPVQAVQSGETGDPAGEMAGRLRELIAGLLGVESAEVRTDAGFYELGLDSVAMLRISRDLEEVVGSRLYPTLLFEFSDIDSLARHLVDTYGPVARSGGEDGVAETAGRPAAASGETGMTCLAPVWAARPAAPTGERDDFRAPGDAGGPGEPAEPGDLVLVGGTAVLADALRDGIAGTGRRVVHVTAGEAFAVIDRDTCEMRPGDRDQARLLLGELSRTAAAPRTYVVVGDPGGTAHLAGAETADRDGPYHAVWALAAALADHRIAEPVDVLYVHAAPDGAARPGDAAVGALARTLSAEVPALRCRRVEVDADEGDVEALAAAIVTEAAAGADAGAVVADAHGEVLYRDGERFVRGYTRARPGGEPLRFREGGVYVLAGGTGGIGALLAGHLARRWRARLALLGRGPLRAGTATRMAAWEEAGAEVVHLRADITDASQTMAALDKVRALYGRVDGVFHCAGLVRDAVFFAKDPAASAEVLRTKIDGAVNLDRATADDDLDMFVLFSSLSATLPNPGQCDYAYGNAFVEHFARVRAERPDRSGRTLAIGWPYWAEGGMRVAPEALERARASSGLAPMPTEVGLRTLEEAGAYDEVTIVAAYGDPAVVGRTVPAVAPRECGESGERGESGEPAEHGTAMPGGARTGAARGRGAPATGTVGGRAGAAGRDEPAPIAVIGMAGRYPQARDLRAFWRNLAGGRDCVTEVPVERWDHEEIFDARRGTAGRTYGRWGGFVDGVDRFDHAFFGISRRDAERMDPQERLFLMVGWHALEDAGYPPVALSGLPVGVFVGVMWNHYQLLDSADDGVRPMAVHSAIANRVSYTFDLHGPSIALDTACSSSLTALHLAVESVRRGECDLALAGGVNLSVHPQKYLQLAQGQFLSDDGRCRAFGRDGTGYVPGEGAGAVLLKPLDRALADGDHVYGVIRACAVNHSGRTSGFTVPSPAAQARVIGEAVRRAGIDPRTVGYVEAHGTGTSLGDPIEIEGLRQAFAGVGLAPGVRSVGSVKSNIGHLESAAGIAGVTKALLQLRHSALAPSLHAAEPNPHIDVANSPFRVQQRLERWPEPEGGGPRRAGVSAFGAGGSNAHVILEEAPRPPRRTRRRGPHLFVLSARTRDALGEYARAYLSFLRPGDDGEPLPELADLAYTSQVGRTPMPVRLAVLADDLEDIRTALSRFADGEPGDGVRSWTSAETGAAAGSAIEPATGAVGDDGVHAGSDPVRLFRAGRLAEVAAAWAGGADVPWAACHPRPARRVPMLPGYPFAEERCWLGDWRRGGTEAPKALVSLAVAADAHAADAADASEDGPARRAVAAGGSRPLAVHATLPEATPPEETPPEETPHEEAAPEQTVFEAPSEQTAHVPREEIVRAIEDALCEQLYVSRQEIDPRTPFSDMGVDSITAELVRQELGERFGVELDSVAVYDHPTVERLADFVHELCAAGPVATCPTPEPSPQAPENGAWAEADGAEEPSRPRDGAAVREPDDDVPPGDQTTVDACDGGAPPTAGAATERAESGGAVPDGGLRGDDIAVIGMSGRFPGAPDLDAFWAGLAAGRCAVTEIPRDRWDADACYDPDRTVPGKSCSRWAAMLDDVDAFDAGFFGVSPLEAEVMDPQQRLFLEEAWKALEDAGYAAPGSGRPPRCGVFVGSGAGDYARLLQEEGVLDSGYGFLGTSPSILAARVSYLLDLTGPTMAVDTACSSSLVAIHLACESIRTGQCETAIAGGVALMLTPQLQVRCSQVGMLSPTGRCAPFAASADGTVLGEGIGVVVLKRLDRALSDGDHIHGVIRATGVNGDGRTNGITAPSATSQTDLLTAVHRRAGVRPDDIGYVEAHGTGTPLGDPIEVKALSQAFRTCTDRVGFCGIGSVKANVGHTTMAAGVAGLIKVLLAMRHGKLPPAVHFDGPNPHIDFDGSPFYVVRELTDWRPGPSGGRVATVSSFGFSGTNCHIVVAEPPRPVPRDGHSSDEAHVVPVSARTDEALRRRLADLAGAVAALPASCTLEDVAYTLAVGRRHLPVRAAVVARDLPELEERLRALLRTGRAPGSFLIATPVGAEPAGEAAGAPADETADKAAGEAERLAAAYVRGEAVDWAHRHRGRRPRRVPLPAYPFARDRHWIGGPRSDRPTPRTAQAMPEGRAREDAFGLAVPWLLRDHQVNGEPILPAAAAVEAVAGAATRRGSTPPFTLSSVRWLRPLGADHGPVHVELAADGTFALTAGDPATPYVTGRVSPAHGQVDTLDLAAIRARCRERRTADELYRTFTAAGIEYGPAFRTLTEVLLGPEEALGTLTNAPDGTPVGSRPGEDRFTVHPALLDGALQTAAALVADGATGPAVPFSADLVDVLAPLTGPAYAHVTRDGEHHFTIEVADRDGRVLVRLSGLVVRPVPDALDGMLYVPQWREAGPRERVPAGADADGGRRVLVVHTEESAALARALLALHNGGHTRALPLAELDPARLDPPYDRVYYLAGTRPGDASGHPVMLGLFRLMKALIAGERPGRGTLTVVTSGAVPFDGMEGGPADAAARAEAAGLLGLARAFGAEYPRWTVTCVDLGDVPDPGAAARAVRAETEGTPIVVRRGDRRLTRTLVPARLPAAGLPFPEGGVCLVVGGASGIGYELSRHLARAHGARLAWIGRRERDAEIERRMAEIASLGGEAVYERADVCDPAALRDAVARVRKRFGPVDGAVHSAAVPGDRTLANLDEETFLAALAPKTTGLVTLHEALRGEPLRFLVLFSSAATFVDTPGQAAYAAAGTFEDAYGLHLREAGAAPAVIVNWGYWGAVGMGADDRHSRRFADLDVGSIEPAEGMAALTRIVAAGVPQALVVKAGPAGLAGFGIEGVAPGSGGDRQTSGARVVAGARQGDGAAPSPAADDGRVAPAAGGTEAAPATVTGGTGEVPVPVGVRLDRQARDYVKRVFAEMLKFREADLGERTTFENFGIDSLISLNIINRFERDLGPLPSTLLFEQLTIEQLARYLAREHAERLSGVIALEHPEWPGQPEQPEQSDRPALSTSAEAPGSSDLPDAFGAPAASGASVLSAATSRAPSAVRDGDADGGADGARPVDVAIIGVSGRYPGSPDLAAFWRNLAEGNDCVTEVPADRWDWRPHFDPRRGRPQRTYSRWGGFIEGVDKFDAGFFGILPRDAVNIDPQERLFLETTWNLLEDAGYLGEHTREPRTGVFVGIMYGTYGELGATQWPRGRLSGAHSAYWSVANRVSYFFDLSGPSFAVDSACSSSLTAVHLAVESIRRGECRMAIAGGVNLILHPNHHVSLCAMNMLSADGACKVFDARADGYVPGEGVGAVLLKPLDRALADGDRIWGVIRGSAVNAGGKTAGFTVPNPNAQAELVSEALRRARVDPRTISYVEAHGTGTELGDPIEVSGLTRAFGAAGDHGTGRCAIGSVKANIGHLEAAAGVAGLTKVLLQMRHGTIAPCVHLETLSPKIDFAGSPFLPSSGAREWARPVVDLGGGPRAVPRRAGVSSFGAGGANAHVIVEEHTESRPRLADDGDRQLFLLSARNAERLRAYAARVADFVDDDAACDATLRELAYTSQVGRQEMTERLAVLATDRRGLAERLRAYVSGEPHPDVVTGRAEGAGTLLLLDDDEGAEFVATLLARRSLPKLARVWVAGAPVDWPVLWSAPVPLRASFPTYPFQRRRYWLDLDGPVLPVNTGAPDTTGATPATGPTRAGAGDARAASLGGSMTSVPPDAGWPGSGETALLRLDGGEPHLTDHRVGGVRWLPGAAVLGLVRSASGLSGAAVALRDVRWHHPINLESGIREVSVHFIQEEDARRFRVLGPGRDGAAYTEGLLARLAAAAPAADGVTGPQAARRDRAQVLELDAIRSRCGREIDVAGFYRELGRAGLDYGPGLRVVSALRVGDGECLARLTALAVSTTSTAPTVPIVPALSVAPTALAMSAVSALSAEPDPVAARGVQAAQAAYGSSAGEPSAEETGGDGDDGGLARQAALLDGAFQAAAALVEGSAGYVPVGLDQALFLVPLPSACWVHVVEKARDVRGRRRFDLRLVDDDGAVLLAVDGLTVAPVTQPAPAGTGRISAPTSASTSAPIGGSDGGGWQSAGSIDAARASVAAATAVATATQGDAGAGECRYLRPVWRPAGPPRQGRPPRVALLDLADEPLRLAVGSELAGRGVTCVSVVAGADYGRRDDGTYTLIPGHPDHCRRVMDDLAGRGLLPDAFLRVPAAGARDASADVREGFHAPFWTAVSILGRNGGAPLRAVVAHGDGTGLIRPAYAAVAGTLRTLALEHSRFTAARVEVDPGTSGERLAALLAEELCAESGGVTEVRYDSAGRHVRGLDDFTPADVAGLPLRPGGTYLITGGAGALGLLVAEFLAGHGPVNLVLTGRSPLDETRRARVEALDREGVRVRYLAADIAVRSDAERLLQRVREEFGALHGVVHAAGVTRDARAVLKTPGEVAEVLAPKIDGALHLDALTRDDPLDFFVLFSSATAEMGNLGQADYAYANGFLDAFAREREQERQAGRRAGRTVAIGYPLWREGGMAVDEATERLMARHWGIAPLSTPAGLEAFRRALAGDEPSFVVFQPAVAESTGGPGARDAAMPSRVAYEASGAASGGVPAHASEEGGGQHAEGYAAHVERDLRAVAARFLLVDQSEVDPDADLMELGFDSVSLTELINEVNERYSLELLPTVLFECPTLTGFAAYLDAHHRAELAARHGNRERPADEGTDRPAADEPVTVAAEPGAARGGDAGDGDGGVREPHGARGPVEVAVVGMAGMLPGSSDLTEFWRHLMRGDDLVGPVPDDRADLRADDRTRHLQGGFLDDVAAFDAGLFGISPAEAALMDPQQRLFLQAAWRAIEDAGHRPSELAGTATGLFAGVATSDYDALLTRHGVPVQAHMATGVAHAVLANRVSHLLDLRGPSEAVDTACSSALVAIHRAVRAIQAGECETALAGGVNVLLNPDVFVAFTQSGMLSPDGRCKTFDAAADGYVRGEGVGVVMLKPLDRALAEGDHVYAVVRGTAVNHCGRSASLTAPNPEAQADVLVRAHREAGADPATVTYIEAHGTGTRLGDPIEIEGLKKAFSRLYEEWGRPMPRTPHIGIGSVKTNIGHLEAAAGIAGVLKVLLAMEHGELPATLHRREVNPYLRLDGTPFHLVDAALSWPVTPGPDGRPIRRAGVSSFGFGGSNAHVVLERAVTREEETVESSHAGPELFVLSAPTRGALRAYATRLAGFLAERPGLELSRVAYTLQAGREELRERLAVVAASHEELVSALRAAAEGDTAARGDRATGDTTPGHHGVIHLGTAARNAGPCDEEDLHALARAWVAGARVDWAAHRARRAGRGARPPRRLPMPSFPFSRTRFWFTREESRPVPEVITEVTVQKPNQHVRHSMGPRPARRARVRLAPPDAARGQEDPAWPGEPRERPEPAARGVAAPADGGRTASSEPAALHAPPELTPRPVAAPAFVRVTAEAAAPVTRSIREHLARILAMPAEEIEGDRPFAELGLDSIFRMDLARKLGAAYGLELKAEDMYEHDSVDALAAHITSLTAPSGGRPTHDGDARGSHTPNGHAPAAGAPAGGALSGNRTSEMNGNHAFAMRGDDAEHGDGREAAERAVRDLVESVIRRPLDPTRSFEHNALTSFDMLRVISALEKRLGGLRKSLLFDRPTLAELTRWLRDTFGAAAVASLGASGDGAPSRVGPGIPDGATGSSASRAVESSAEEKGAPLIVPRAAVAGRPGLREVVADLERRYAKETGLAGRDIAPLLFLGSSRQGFFTFSQRDDDLFSWSYVGSEEHFTELAAEYLDYARGRGLRASFLSLRRLEEAGGHRLTATPFGAVQRLEDLSRFTLKGGRMSRLRYMVQRFERSGSCRTVEYRSGSDPATDRRLAELVDRWAGGKQMTNPYVRRVREEIREGLLDERHRVFLTYLDDALANAVVVTRIPSENGYLLDVEFYPADGPLGGLEYAIVQIIGVLVAEGCTLFSFGASFGAKVCDSPNAAPEVEQGLEELRGAGIFGAGNFQFKNKFRPVNVPLYLCQPADGPRTPVADVILMIADPSAPTGITAPAAPDRPTASDDGPASDGRAAVSAPAAVAVSSGPSRRGDAGPAVTAEEREALLAAHGHNPLRLPPEAVEFDLVTDSWAERTDEVVARRAEELIRRAAEPGAGDELTPPWLPFETVVAAPSGRAAEALLCRSWPGRRGAVPHNGLFPTLLFNLADNGFDPVPLPSVSSGHFGGDLDLAALDRALEAGEIAFVAVELTGNAGGGAPVSAANLRQVRERAAAQGVPVVVDATRVVENAVFVAEHEPGHQGRGVWDVVRDLLSLADVVTMSATKDFGVHAGGLVATRLPEVAARLREEAELRGPGLNLLDRRALSLALADCEGVLKLVRQRMRGVRTLWRSLDAAGVPLAGPTGGPPGGHCLLLDLSRMDHLAGLPHPVPSFLAWMFRETGVRGGPHLAGDRLVRLAVPLGYGKAEIDLVAERLTGLFGSAAEVPCLVTAEEPVTALDAARAAYRPAGEVPSDIQDVLREGYRPADQNWAAVREAAPGVRRTLVAYVGGQVEVLSAGEGPTLLLMHPFNMGAGVFARQFRDLAGRCRVVVIHHPGVGATTADGDISLDGITALHFDVLRRLGVEFPVHVAGASFGSLLAQNFALRHPEATASLSIICGSYKYANRAGAVNRLERVVAEDLDHIVAGSGSARIREQRDDLEAALLRCESMDPRIGLRYLDVFAAEPDLLGRLPGISVPTLIVQGRHDSVIPLKTAHLLHGLIPDARYVEIPDAGHFPCVTHPEEVNHALAGFLRLGAGDERPGAAGRTASIKEGQGRR